MENSESIIENCKIRDLSKIDRTYTPAILLEGVGIKVRHCLFSEIPGSAIRLEGNDMLIEMNEFTRCVIESDDQGAIDVFGNPLHIGNILSDCHAAISQLVWGDKRWETTLREEGHPVSIALNVYNLQGDLWQKHYPALKHLTEGGTDGNYSVNNIVINGQFIFLRKLSKFQCLNNSLISQKEVLHQPLDYQKYDAPWYSIPLQRIGPY